MGDAISWLVSNWQLIGGIAGGVVMGASIAVRAIAPHTATKKDDKAADWLDTVHRWLSKVALNPPLEK